LVKYDDVVKSPICCVAARIYKPQQMATANSVLIMMAICEFTICKLLSHSKKTVERSYLLKKVYYIQRLKAGKSICTIVTLCFACLSVFLQAVPVYAGAPIEQVKINIGELISILDDKTYRESHSREELNGKLRGIAHDKFDWDEIAKRSLGLYWRKRSQDEKKEFTALLTKLLLNNYIKKVLDNYAGEKVLYDREIIDGERALVKTRIINNAEKEISVGYRLIKKEKNWIAYDVIIEGVSLVKNYRVQFYTIIRKSSYNELMKKIQEKLLGNT
jgi:phospholipid transport system substrate-binding protein